MAPRHYYLQALVLRNSRVLKNIFQPGGEVPTEGVYRVYHYRHRLSHLVRIRFLFFPECDQCGERVRFETVLLFGVAPKAPCLTQDVDFQRAAAHVPRKQEAS